MVLTNASLKTGIMEFARRFSGSNSTSYPDADLKASINVYYDMFTAEIFDSMSDWDFSGEIATASLVAGQQEYTFPTDIVSVKRVEVTYDGTTWYPVTKFDINERKLATDTTSVRNDFETSNPFCDLYDNSLFLYPIPQVSISGGIKIWYEKFPTALSANEDEPVFNRAFHVGLAQGAAKDWLENFPEGKQDKITLVNNNLGVTIAKMKRYYSKQDQDRDMQVLPAYVDYGYGHD